MSDVGNTVSKTSDTSFILREITKSPATPGRAGSEITFTCAIDTSESLDEVVAIWSLADPLDTAVIGFIPAQSNVPAQYTLNLADPTVGEYSCTLLFPDDENANPKAKFYVVG